MSVWPIMRTIIPGIVIAFAIIFAAGCSDTPTATPAAPDAAPQAPTVTVAPPTPSGAGTESTPRPAASATPESSTSVPLTPLRPAGAAAPPDTEQLRANADAFQYSPGAHGGQLTLATISDPLTFNLAIANDASSSGVLSYVFEGLTEASWLDDEIEPLLARSWEASDDGMTWTFHLRDDVRWHDGTPFTAQDVEFTFNEIIYNEDIPASSRSSFTFRQRDEDTGIWEESQMAVVAVDDYTLVCILPQPFAPFLRSMGTAIFPRHILKEHVDDGTFNEVWDITTPPSEIIGTGPFTIESYRPGESVIMARNDDYWLKDDGGNSLPYLDRVEHIIVPELEDELTYFLAGRTDIHGVLGKEYAQLEPLQGEQSFTIYRRGPTFGTTFLVFNVNPGPNVEHLRSYIDPLKRYWFSNTEFRQAVAHVIDKERIIDEAQHGFGYPQWSSISPAAGDFHNPNVRQYPYSIDTANKILDDLGWIDRDGDRVREDDTGNPISFSMVTNDGNSVRQAVGAIAHEGMAAIGLDVEFEVIDFGELVDQLTTTYDWEAVVIGLTGGTEPHDGINVWHSSEPLHMWHPNQRLPATDWEAALDELYVDGSRELDRQRRVELYHRAQDIVADNVPLIYTTLGERITALRNTFGNTTATLYGLFDVRYLYRTDQ